MFHLRLFIDRFTAPKTLHGYGSGERLLHQMQSTG